MKGRRFDDGLLFVNERYRSRMTEWMEAPAAVAWIAALLEDWFGEVE